MPGGAEPARQIDYPELWAKATPFHTFLANVKARADEWHPRFSNAAIEATALNQARALPGRRRILAIAEDRCSDSAWAVPYLAKLAAVVPEEPAWDRAVLGSGGTGAPRRRAAGR